MLREQQLVEQRNGRVERARFLAFAGFIVELREPFVGTEIQCIADDLETTCAAAAWSASGFRRRM